MGNCFSKIRQFRILELFSGTHSVGVVSHEMGMEVHSLDMILPATSPFKADYKSAVHYQMPLDEFQYKKFKPGHFDIVWASPVCAIWSHLKKSWLGRSAKSIRPDGGPVRMEDIERTINEVGKPMVDRCFDIIEYLKPQVWFLENPQNSLMKHYIAERWSKYNTFYDLDYCAYNNFGYRKRTRFWTNLQNYKAKRCAGKGKCPSMLTEEEAPGRSIHRITIGCKNHESQTEHTTRWERYRVPYNIMREFFKHAISNGQLKYNFRYTQKIKLVEKKKQTKKIKLIQKKVVYTC
jgi:hypothetical protein